MRCAGRVVICDICGKSMQPFEYITLDGVITIKEDIQPNVFDIYDKTVSRNDLCKECFNDVMDYINKSKKKG